MPIPTKPIDEQTTNFDPPYGKFLLITEMDCGDATLNYLTEAETEDLVLQVNQELVELS